MSATYFGGKPAHMGQVFGLPHRTFHALVNEMIRVPVQLPISRHEMHALSEKEPKNERKKTDYIVGAVFKSDPSPRQTGLAVACNLLFIDIDDADEAQRLINAGFEQALGDHNAVVWHTARSTAEKPRLRVCVPVDHVPVSHYAPSVTALAGTLGMNALNSESKVSVQPMYLPVQYVGSDEDPVIYAKTDGRNFDTSQVMQIAALPHSASGAKEADLADLDHLRMPDDSISSEIAAEALTNIDAACSMQQWVEIGMALKHQFGDSGFTLWDDWSATSKEKYPDQATMAARWESFRAHPRDRAPVTIRSVVKLAKENGWDDVTIADRTFDNIRQWLREPSRTIDELLHDAPQRIAQKAANLDPFRQKTLVSELMVTMKGRGMKVSQTDVAKEVRKLIADEVRSKTPPPPWSNSIAFLTAPNLFYRYVDHRKMKPQVVDLVYRSPDPEKRAGEFLIHGVGIPVAENLRYEPADPKRVITIDGVPYINTYRRTYPKADPATAEEAGALWIEHGQNLHGLPYWITMTDWAAFLVQHPGHKIRWAPIIQGAVGCGKGLIAYMLTLVLGSSNVQRLAAEHVIEGDHTGWAAGFQLTVVDEVYNGPANRSRTMNRFKLLISDDMISVRPIYEPVATVPNVTNYLMFTNHHDALAVHDDDRRYFYLPSPLQKKADVTALGDGYFDRIYGGARKNAAGLRAFFESWPISPTFSADGRAPVTPFLKDLAAHSATPLHAAVVDTIDDEPHALVRKDLVSVTALRAVMPSHIVGYSDQALSSILLERGFRSAGRHHVDGKRHTLFTKIVSGDIQTIAQQRMDLL